MIPDPATITCCFFTSDLLSGKITSLRQGLADYPERTVIF